MPFIKLDNREKSNNKGSCYELVKYLNKENGDPEVPIEKKQFFYDRSRDFVLSSEVTERIDKNKKKLRKEQAKFFMLTINYSQSEIKHLNQLGKSDPEKCRALRMGFTRRVMEEYRLNFNIPDLRSEEVLWFAKDEHHRYYKGYDLGKKTGSKKEGGNDHTHIIISRLRDGQTRAISPLTNHKSVSNGAVKQGFSRVDFKERVEAAFDEMFGYDRPYNAKFRYLNAMVNGTKKEREKEQAAYEEWKRTPGISKVMSSMIRTSAIDARAAEEEERKADRKRGLNY